MNYIAQLNSFFEFKQTNTLSSNAQSLYVNLLHINNRCGWKRQFTVSNITLQSQACLSRQQLDKARNELINRGLIQYQKGNGNRPGQYLIVRFDTQTDTQTLTQTMPKLIHTANPFLKQKQNKNQTKQGERNKQEILFAPPTLEQVTAYCTQKHMSIEPEQFFYYYEACGWKVGPNDMADWQAALQTWEGREKARQAQAQRANPHLCYEQRKRAEQGELNDLVQY